MNLLFEMRTTVKSGGNAVRLHKFENFLAMKNPAYFLATSEFKSAARLRNCSKGWSEIENLVCDLPLNQFLRLPFIRKFW